MPQQQPNYYRDPPPHYKGLPSHVVAEYLGWPPPEEQARIFAAAKKREAEANDQQTGEHSDR